MFIRLATVVHLFLLKNFKLREYIDLARLREREREQEWKASEMLF